MSPTYAAPGRFVREHRKLSRRQRLAFQSALLRLVAALREAPPAFPPELRVKRVRGRPEVWEMSFAPDGRATFSYGAEVRQGEPHIVWRRIGTHDILRDP